MQRFGLLLEDSENIFVYEKLFDDVLCCISEGIAHSSFCGRKLYFKILSNRDIISHLHRKDNDVVVQHYGYLHLSKSDEIEQSPLKVIKTSKILLPSLFHCISDEKKERKSTNCKIAYFVILTDDQVVHELHKNRSLNMNVDTIDSNKEENCIEKIQNKM